MENPVGAESDPSFRGSRNRVYAMKIDWTMLPIRLDSIR